MIIVPSGLGDIYWVCQRLVPAIGDKLDIVIAHSDDGSPLSNRSVPWLQSFPFIASVTTQYMPTHEYNQILDHTDLTPILNDPTGTHSYALNRPLEQGIKLADIDSHPVNWKLPLTITPWELPYPKYQCLFVSTLGPWKPLKWAHLANQSQLPSICLGCSWDRKPLEDVVRHLEQPYHRMIDQPPAAVLHALQNASLYIGFQSGLNIMADRLSIPQIMMYFASLRRMAGTWNNPQNTNHYDYCWHDNFEQILHVAQWYGRNALYK
jgi:hypothetical protein